MKIAIFASGSGSNAENIVNYLREKKSALDVSLIICNKSDAFVLHRAEKLKIPAIVMSKSEINDEQKMMTLIRLYEIKGIVLAGFLLQVPAFLITAFPQGIINIHPALLPLHGGKGMYGDHVHKAVIDAGDKESGITIHYVTEHYDEGQPIFQASCAILPHFTANDVASAVHGLEYAHFPHVIEEVFLGKTQQK